MARLQTVSRELELAVRGDLSPTARSRLIAETARGDIVEIDRANDAAVGIDVKYHTVVDGRADAPLDTVNPDRGVIAAAWDLGTDVVATIGDMLREHSPVLTGRYRASHLLFADGVQVNAPPDPALRAKEWVWLSGVPYARKIEKRVADGVYEGVAALARRRFGNIAKISFTMSSLAAGGGSALDIWASSASGKAHAARHSHRREALRGEWLRRQPAIVIAF